MSSPMMPSDVPPPQIEANTFPPIAGLNAIAPLRMAKRHPPEEYVDRARHEIATVLYFWGYRPELWTILGFTASPVDRLSAAAPAAHPIVEVLQESPFVVRGQSLTLSERDTIARHAFMRHLATSGLPIPTLRDRPEGVSYAVVPFVPLTDPQQASGFTYSLENAIYELQAYIPGRRFVTDGASEDTHLAAAARTLAELHNASRDYAGPDHLWPDDRTPLAIARVYLTRTAEASRGAGVARSVATCLRRLARDGAHWTTEAAARLDARRDLLRLHVHGDYQPHNLVFDGDRVAAIYDFDAMHHDLRVMELAYALLAFTGLRWEDETAASISSAPTPPLLERGLDMERATTFLDAYGQIAPPQPSEADGLADAMLLALPVIFANGVAQDLVFPERATYLTPSSREARARVEWAETFPTWLDANRTALRDAWSRPAGH